MQRENEKVAFHLYSCRLCDFVVGGCYCQKHGGKKGCAGRDQAG